MCFAPTLPHGAKRILAACFRLVYDEPVQIFLLVGRIENKVLDQKILERFHVRQPSMIVIMISRHY